MRSNFQSLSLFRILLALYLGIDFFANVLPWYGDFYTDRGMMPRAAMLAYNQGHWLPSLLLLSDSPLFHAAFIGLHLAALLAFGLGYRTRLATITLLITYTSLYWRNYLLASGAETLVRLLLLWAAFLPLARYWSLDAARDPRPPGRPYPKLLLAGIRGQIGMIYIFSALYKLSGDAWRRGDAVALALGGNIYGGTVGGLWLLHHGGWLLPWLTWGTVAFQLLFTPLVYCPWYNGWTRGLALAGAAALHASFIVLLGVGMFPYICLIYLIVLVPDAWWERWRRLPVESAPAPAHPAAAVWALPAQVLCTGLLALALTYNLYIQPWPAFPARGGASLARAMPAAVTARLTALTTWTGVKQVWNLFAPSPDGFQERWVFTGTTADQAQVDLLPRWQPAPFQPPDRRYRLEFANHDVRKYFFKLAVLLNRQPGSFVDYVCRKVNTGTPEIVSISVSYYMLPANRPFAADAVPALAKTFPCPPG